MNTIYRPRAAGLLCLIAGLLASGCSDGPAGPGGAPEPPTLPGLVVSEVVSGASGSDGGQGLTYVSLSPESLPTAANVRIRNSTTGFDALPPTPVIDGGFDPVTIPASTGDRLEVIITDAASGTRTETATVPVGRAPVIVRTILAGDPSEVPVDARPRVVFSEPIRENTLQNGVRVTSAAGAASIEVLPVTGEPWVVEVVPTLELDPLSTYKLILRETIRDLSGDTLEALVTATFTTAGTLGVEGRIAFASTRDGDSHIYVMNADGSGLRRLARGDSPAWAPDGRRIAFQTLEGYYYYYAVSDVRVIDVDGSNERVLANEGGQPVWLSDGSRVAFVRVGEVFVVNADGSGEALLIGGDSVEAATGVRYLLDSPALSPDGKRLAFLGYDSSGATPSRILIANADGSGIDRFPLLPSPGRSFSYPTWWGDGSRLAFTVGDSIASAALDGTDVRTHGVGWRPDSSADGKYLLYDRLACHEADWSSGTCPLRIFVAELDGTRHRRLVPVPASPLVQNYSDLDAAWSRARN